MRRCALLASFFLQLFAAHLAHADDVDLAIVLAVDVSASVSQERWDLQRRGYAEAFRNGDVIGAIRNGRRGAIAVALLEWSGPDQQASVVGWTVIDGEDAARSFAGAVADAPRVFANTTSISGAIDRAVGLLEACPHEGEHRVIDVSGDGANNAGRPADLARDEAVARGITINGLPILADEPGVDTHYREHVIGGPGSFMVVARDFESFASAILSKLVREIAFAGPVGGGGDVEDGPDLY